MYTNEIFGKVFIEPEIGILKSRKWTYKIHFFLANLYFINIWNEGEKNAIRKKYIYIKKFI